MSDLPAETDSDSPAPDAPVAASPSDDLARSREEVERRIEELRTAVRSEFGWVPRTRTWLVPLVAAAGGLALAVVLTRGRRRRARGVATKLR